MPIPELAEPKRTSSPAAPAPIPGSSLLQAVDSNAQSLRAGAPAPKSALLDTVGQDAEALRQYEDQKRRAMYGIPVSDDEYSLISSALALSQNPDEERWNWASAKMYSQRLGIPMESARANLESISQSWLQSPNITNGKSHFEAIADSFRIGDLTMDAANLAKQWKDTGGQDQDLERKIDALYGEMAQMQDRWPRSVIPTALKYGAESAPFMAQVLGKGAMAGGAAAAAVAVGTAAMGGTAATFGLAAPVGAAAMASALTLAASQTGSFMASMQIMEALDYYDMRKKGVSHEIAAPMAMVSGGVQATLESFLGNVPGLIGKVGGKTITGISGNIAKGLLISGKSGALGTALMGYGGEILEEGAEEALQSISSDVIKNIAYGLSGAGIAQTEAGEIAKNAWDNFKGGALASLGYGLPGAFIGYKGAARQSKALKEYAGMTDRETFIEQAGKWNEIESVPEEHRKAALSKIWEQAQQKAKETREAVPEGEAKPFKRTESGDLYTEEITVDSVEEGKVEAILKVGDADSKERLGYLRYEITDDGIVLSDAHFSKGRGALRDEAILTLAAKYPGLPITAASGASEATQAAVDRLTAANPKGTGANWYAEGEDQNVAQARSKLRLAISDKMPNVSPAQREAAILMHEFRANAMGVRFDDYLKNEFSSEIIGTDMGRVSAAQGQRAGVLFTKGGQELRIGEFVRDAKALVMVTEKSDFVSFVHESGHMFRKQLIDTDLGKQLDEAYQIVGGTWTREHEERFVDDLVKYLSYGEVKDEKLRGVFSRIAEWITRLWDKVLNQADVDPRIRSVMDELFKSDVSPLQEASMASAIANDGVSSEDASALEQGGKEEVLFQDVKPNSTLSVSSSLDKAMSAIEKYFYDKPGDIELVPVSENLWAIRKVKSGKVLDSFRIKLDKGRYRFEDGAFEIKIPEAKVVSYDGKQGVLFQTYTPSPKKNQLFDAVIAEHGTTKNLSEAGFILPDGRLVDLSGRNEDPDYKMVGDHYETKGGDYLSGKRLLAHADVRWSGSPQGARGFLVRQGAIRVDAKYGILEMDNEPTAEQLPWIRDVLSQGKEVGVEMHDGKRSGDIRGDDPKKTLGLIRRFYDGEDIGRVLFQYVGEKAALEETEQQNLSVAKEMAQSGKDSETIRQATGWFKGKYDGKWRLETKPKDFRLLHYKKSAAEAFDDYRRDAFVNGATDEDRANIESMRPYKDMSLDELKKLYRVMGETAMEFIKEGDKERGKKYLEQREGLEKIFSLMGGRKYGPLSAYVDAPDLFAKYPQLRDLHVRIDPDMDSTGSYFRKSRDRGEQIVLKEDPSFINKMDSTLVHEIQHWIQEKEGFARGSNLDMYLDEYDRLMEEVKKINKALSAADKDGDKDKYNQLMEAKQLILPRIVELQGKDGIVGFDMYLKTAGEIEARDVASRMGLSPEQREALAPYSSEDIAADDAVILFQLDDETINTEALKYNSWEEWKADEEATAEWIGDQARPGDLEGKDLDDWYRDRWEAARAKADETEAAARTEQRREARRGEFAATMAKAGGVESLLREIWDAEVQAFDTAQASDEQESAEIDKAYEWKKELAQRLAGHPLVLLAAQSVGNGKKLKPSTRKAILAYVRNNEIEFAALYAELTGDLDLAQYAEAGRAKLQSIPDPRLDKYADMSIAERTALLNRVSDQEVRARIKAGELSDPEFVDYVRRLEEAKKSLTKEAEDAKAEIEKLGGDLENESDFAMKMYDRSKTASKALESTQKELDKAKAAKERVEAAKSAYVEALGSARDESRLSAKIAKKEYIAALNEARKEAAFQARFVAAEIRATTKLRAQRDSLRRYIMKKPAKNIVWEKKQQIKTIQEYLRSKKWEYIEEQDEAGKIKRRRAYDTVVGDDGKTHKVPRYTTVQAENLQAALSMLLRESPNLKKLLTNGIVDRINEKPVTAWTVSELQDLREIIDRLAKEGRENYEIKRMMENREAASDRYDITRAIRENKRYKEPAARGSDEEKAIKKKMEGFATWELPAMKMRYFAPLLDGGTEGVNTKVLVHDEYAARREKQAQKVRRLNKVQTRMRELNLTQKERQRKITIAGIGPGATDVTMSAARLSHVALLLRNAKGRDAFIYGNLFSERERSSMNREFLVANGDMKYRRLVATIESNLTAAEKEIIDLIGKGFVGTEFDRQNKAIIELTNEEMKPEANYSPLYREGAYFDSQKDSIVEAMKAKHGFIVNPESGFTIARINIAPEHQSPVRIMDIVAMFEDAVDTQEHLIAYGAYVKKIHSVYQNQMQSRAVREGIIQTFGKDGMKYIDEYIGAVSQPNADSGVNGPGNKALRKLRGYQAVGFLAYRWTSVVKQLITSPMPYMAYAPKETLASAFQAMGSGNMFKFIEEIEKKSGMLQSRTIDQIFEAIKTMDSEGWEGLVKKIGTVGMKGLEFADRVSVAIGWKGVYDKEISQGATEEEAVKKADDITFQTQPSANPADLAPIYRDMNEWKRILLMFTSSLNTVYNNIRHGVPKAIRENEYGQAVGIVTSYAVAGVLLGAFAKSLGKDPPPDDPDEWWRQWVFYSMTQFTDSVPLIGSEVSGVMKRMVTKSKGTPFGEDTMPTVTAIIKGFDALNKKDIEKAAENFAEGVGLATGLPTLAIEEYAKNIGSLMEGE